MRILRRNIFLPPSLVFSRVVVVVVPRPRPSSSERDRDVANEVDTTEAFRTRPTTTIATANRSVTMRSKRRVVRGSFRSRRASSGRSPNRIQIQIQSIRASVVPFGWWVGPRGCRWIWLCMHKQLFTTCVVYEHSRVGLKISTSARASDSFLSLDVIFIR